MWNYCSMTEYNLGHLEAVPVGTVFHKRREVRDAGLHRHLVNGIDGDECVTRSIVAAGIYSGDRDYGVSLWYAGQGGLDRDTGVQVGHQRFEGPNAGLAASSGTGLAIRLIRGWGPRKGAKVYRYDGLYQVTRYWLDQTGKFDICMYQLDAVVTDIGYPFLPELDPLGHPTPVSPGNAGKLRALGYRQANHSTYNRLSSLERAGWACDLCRHTLNVSKGQLLRVVGEEVASVTGQRHEVLCNSCFDAYVKGTNSSK
jgi:hypothetical protein